MKKYVPTYEGTLRKHALTVPHCISKCSGIRVFGRRIKSLVFSTDVAIIKNINADAVIAVAGLSALGRPLGEVCHRPELAKLRFDLEPDQIVTPELMAMLLSSPLAQRKDVGSRPYAVLLNQADRAWPDEIAALATLLLQKGVERVVAAALQRRPGEYEVWKR